MIPDFKEFIIHKQETGSQPQQALLSDDSGLPNTMVLSSHFGRAGYVGWLVECPPNMCEDLGSVLSTHRPSQVARACSPSTWDEEAEGSEVQVRPRLYRKFGASLGYIRLCL